MVLKKLPKRFRFALLATLSLLLLAMTLWAYGFAWENTPAHSVVISELMASNEQTLADEDGEYSDWIEIHNGGSTDVNLAGWYLTDDADNLTKWQVPDTLLPAGDYLVLFASGKDRALPEDERQGLPLHTNFKLNSGGEYLALVEPGDTTVVWQYAPQYPALAKDLSYGLDEARQARYLTLPTAGEANQAADLGPIISNVTHVPALAGEDDALTVNVTIAESGSGRGWLGSRAAVGEVTLHYRVMFGEVVALPMFDDGSHEDGTAGDGVYGATIPSQAYGAGEMVRYYITAQDKDGRSSRWPLFHDANNSPEYLGTMITDPNVTSSLPILYWFVEDSVAAETRTGTRASLFYDGVFYDNLFVRLRGGIAGNWPKKSFKFDFNSANHFGFSPEEEPVEEFNLNSTYLDKSYIRQPLAWDTYRDAGVPYSIAFPMRVQQNGEFYSVAIFIEQPDEQYLKRQGLDPEGALYKMFNTLDEANLREKVPHDANPDLYPGAEKKTRLDEDNSDLQAFVEGIHLPEAERTIYLFDHLNIPQVINYLAATALTQDWDFVAKNYYLYRDTNGTGEWFVLPWDKDLGFGVGDWILQDPDSIGHPLSGSKEHLALQEWNHLVDALYDTPAIQEMYLRRLRTLMDQLLQPPSTPADQLHYEQRIEDLFNKLKPDVALDAAKWPLDWGEPETFRQSIELLKHGYFAPRRIHLYETHGSQGSGLIPDPQPISTTLKFGPLDANPASGNQEEEYLTLLNPNPYAVDISGWQLRNDITHTFQPGVVIPAGGTLYLSPNVVTFRQRPSTPTGGQAHFLQGNYRGHLSNKSGTIELYNAQGMLIEQMTYP